MIDVFHRFAWRSQPSRNHLSRPLPTASRRNPQPLFTDVTRHDPTAVPAPAHRPLCSVTSGVHASQIRARTLAGARALPLHQGRLHVHRRTIKLPLRRFLVHPKQGPGTALPTPPRLRKDAKLLQPPTADLAGHTAGPPRSGTTPSSGARPSKMEASPAPTGTKSVRPSPTPLNANPNPTHARPRAAHPTQAELPNLAGGRRLWLRLTHPQNACRPP